MDRTEAMPHFLTNVVEPARLRALMRLEQDFQTNKTALATEWTIAFQQICKQLGGEQIRKDKPLIGHLTFSLLRTELAVGRAIYLVEATDSSWFFDRNPCQTEYDASWALRYLDQLKDEINSGSKAYMGAITLPDVEQIILKEAVHFHQYVIQLARYALPTAIESQEFVELSTEDVVEIRVGEYMDVSEVVYKIDRRARDAQSVREWIDEGSEQEYAYEVFDRVDLSKGDYSELDFRYSRFEHSDLSDARFNGCVLMGTRWNHSRLAQADFSYSLLFGANFYQSELSGTDFRGIQASQGLLEPDSWEMPGFWEISFTEANLPGASFVGAHLAGAQFSRANLVGVNFAGANLTDANFTDANLRGAVFVGASVASVDFTGADVEGASFSARDQGKLNVDEQQQATVIWIEAESEGAYQDELFYSVPR
ncbi:pentapeptide repeat-containing protein [Brevibacillus laterosporus]|uniref:pentapeptide repeat-containing protein n=1 Tax=Brevibacillus laterosporus TaxID=1465 RepID=UPI003D1F4986